MHIPITAFLFILQGLARAQNISAPNCTDSTFAWVGSLCALTLYQYQRSLPHLIGDFLHIVVQFTQTKSLLGCSVPGGGVLQ